VTDETSGGSPTDLKAVDALLATLDIPHQPVDGDCLLWTPRVVTVLQAASYTAEQTAVVGWDLRRSRTIVFVHQAAITGDGVIIDVTARQFEAQLPSPWIASPSQYCAALARSARVDEVTIGFWA
jgi:hypothetical protein